MFSQAFALRCLVESIDLCFLSTSGSSSDVDIINVIQSHASRLGDVVDEPT